MENNRNGQSPELRSEKTLGAVLTAAIIAVIMIINVIVYVLNLNLGVFYITPAEDDLTELSGATDELFAEAIRKGAKVNIRFCMAEDEVKLHDTGSFVYKTATEYKNRYPELISLDFINLITKRAANGESVADDIERYTADGSEIRTNSVIFECGESFKMLTDIYTTSGFVDFYTLDASGSAIAYDGETVIAGMVAWVLAPEHPKAYLTVGHTEQIDPAFDKLLTLAGYETDELNLAASAVPEDCDLLIIATPQNDFETASEGSSIPYASTETGRLEAYLRSGGNLYVTLDPYIQGLTSLEGVLAKCGFSLSTTDVDGTEIRDIVRDGTNAITTDGYSIITEHADGAVAQAVADRVAGYSDGRVIIRYAGAINLTEGAEALLTSSSSAICENGEAKRTGGDFTVAAYNRLSYGGGESEATVFVCSSLYMTVSSALVTNGYSNQDFVFALFEELYGLENLPYGCNTVLYDTLTLEGLTMSAAAWYTAAALLVPAALLVVGTVVVIRRKNR